MSVPQVYRKSAEGTIASYSFYDLTTGTGYKKFYGIDSISGANAIYSLVTEAVTSNTDSTTFSSCNLNFDLDINVPTILKGRAFFEQPIGVATAGDTITISGAFYKVNSGGTASLIGTPVSLDISPNALGSGNSWCYITGSVDIPQPLVFKKGEKIRYNIIVSGIASTGRLFHDTRGVSVSASYPFTNLIVYLPFRIDL